MTTTAPVTFGLAGMGGTEGTSLGGFGGLFASLLGGAGGAAEGVRITNLNGVAGDGADLAGAMPGVFQFGDGSTLEIQGEASAVTAFLQQVQAVYQKVVVEGQMALKDLDNAGDLANALTKLGMDPALAQVTARRIETMLEMVEHFQGKVDEQNDEAEGGLVALMLAAMMGQQQAQPGEGEAQSFSLEVVTVEQTTIQVSVVRNFRAGGAAEDLLRDMVREPGVDTAADILPAAADGEVGAGEADKPKRAAVFHVSLRDGVPVISAVVPQEARPAAGVSAAVAQVQEQMTVPVVEKVAPEKVLEKPKGEVVYQWVAEKGVETLQAVKPVSAGVEIVLQDSGMPVVKLHGHEAAVLPQGMPAPGLGFAERVALAREGAVARQVAVHIRPLLEDGGGVVRMTLNPPELGEVKIEMRVHEGKVHGAIAASDPVVVEQLARELHSLRHGLAEAGLKLGEQGINLMLSNHQNGNHGGHAQGGAWGGNGAAEGEVQAAAEWVAPERLVDVRI